MPWRNLRAAEGRADAPRRQQIDKMLRDYYQQMSEPKPFLVRDGETWQAYQRQLKQRLLRCTGLEPLPDRLPLDVHESQALDHPWCTVRRIAYQLWPGVYSTGLLFLPKKLPEQPAPAMLCPHGHWENGNAHPEVQKRCLNLARLGYVTFSSTQNHYEDLYVGVSHQTLMIWNNMRALDYLESLPQVDKARIGVAGGSGGGLQAQMLVALDGRVKAASIVGLTCDFREIMFFDRCHCVCNHFPHVMRFTDHPEISALGLPSAVQFLTMNDWTRTFEANNFPTIRALYATNGAADRAHAKYFDTPHSYDTPKREWTYWWMERWLRGKHQAAPEPEPETQTLPIDALVNLKASVPGDKGFGEIGRYYRRVRGYPTPALANAADWRAYCQRMTAALGDLLGEEQALARRATLPQNVSRGVEGDLIVERVDYPSEGPIKTPALVLSSNRPSPKSPSHLPEDRSNIKAPVVILLAAQGKESLLGQEGPDSPVALARAGALVVLPDVRFAGELSSAGASHDAQQRQAWERNGIVWGRPVPGMASTDLRAVLDSLAGRADADVSGVRLVARGSGELAIAALFAAALDPRIASLDLDLAHCCFETRNLPLVPFVLQHGDVLQWAALLADRTLTLRNVPQQAGSTAWLAGAFAAAGNREGLKIIP